MRARISTPLPHATGSNPMPKHKHRRGYRATSPTELARQRWPDREPNLGRFLSKNLAGDILPGNVDVGELDVDFVDDHDPHASPIGLKGIGELGAVGVSAAIANAVFHATGIRVRDLPIVLHHLLSRPTDVTAPRCPSARETTELKDVYVRLT